MQPTKTTVQNREKYSKKNYKKGEKAKFENLKTARRTFPAPCHDLPQPCLPDAQGGGHELLEVSGLAQAQHGDALVQGPRFGHGPMAAVCLQHPNHVPQHLVGHAVRNERNCQKIVGKRFANKKLQKLFMAKIHATIIWRKHKCIQVPR